MDAHVQECAEVCGVNSSLAGRRRSSRRCCWGRNEKAAVGRQRLFLFGIIDQLWNKIKKPHFSWASLVLMRGLLDL